MGLPARQRKLLDRIESGLRGSDPRLAAMFAIFARLTRDEEMPRVEELRHRAAILSLRIRLWLAAGRARPERRRRPRGWIRRPRPVTVVFPAALLLMTLTIVLVARLGASPRCASATAIATARPHPRGKVTPRSLACRSSLSPIQVGR